MNSTPAYLEKYQSIYRQDPHKANLAWFQDAKFGLFIHYGLYTLPGRGEWVQYQEKIPVAEYEKLMDQFRPDAFNADYIARTAAEAGMRYINITTRHHDSFCLFKTRETKFQSMNSPAKRDLIAEMAEACEKQKLGLFLYYSYGADWRHPYFHSREAGFHAVRPDYNEPEPTYLFSKDEDFRYYMDFVHAQIRELLTGYGPVAGIWLDLIMSCYYRPDLFPVGETYQLIRNLQPQCLISFKQGYTGTEDFMSLEMACEPLKEKMEAAKAPRLSIVLAEKAWDMNIKKWNEVCTIMQGKGWSWMKDDLNHKTADNVMELLNYSVSKRCNLLLNTGLLPDGSIHPDDAAALKEVGSRIHKYGYPAGA